MTWTFLFSFCSHLPHLVLTNPTPATARLIQFNINSFRHYDPFVTIVYDTKLTDTKLYHGEKYLVSEAMINSFTWQMNLTVKNLHKPDFEPYTCASENALGKSDARIRLQGKTKQFYFVRAQVILLQNFNCTWVDQLTDSLQEKWKSFSSM